MQNISFSRPVTPFTFEDAVFYDDGELTEELLREGLSVNGCAASGEPLLIEALRARAVQVARVLLNNGADADVRSLSGNTALWEAVPCMSPIWVRHFWHQHDLDARSAGGETALHRAVREKAPELIRLLLSQGATKGLPDEQGETPLMLCRRLLSAATDAKDIAWLRDCERELTEEPREWNPDAYRALLPELQQAERSTPSPMQNLFASFVIAEQEEVPSDWEIEPAEAQPSAAQEEEDPLMSFVSAIERGDIELCRKLLEAGADPNEPVREDESAFDFAAHRAPRRSKEALLELMLTYGANPSRTRGGTYTPLMGAAQAGDESLVRFLLKAGANPYRTAANGTNALSEAFLGGNSAVISLLLDAGVDVCAVDEWNAASPLTEALYHLDTDMVALLLERGAHPFTLPANSHCDTDMVRAEKLAKAEYGSDEKAQTAARENLRLLHERFPFSETSEAVGDEQVFNLLNAAAYGLPHDVRCALRQGTSPDVCNSKGESALYLAARYGHEQVVYTLLRYGANPNVSPSPLTAAEQLDSPARERIARLLRGFGATPPPTL